MNTLRPIFFIFFVALLTAQASISCMTMPAAPSVPGVVPAPAPATQAPVYAAPQPQPAAIFPRQPIPAPGAQPMFAQQPMAQPTPQPVNQFPQAAYGQIPAAPQFPITQTIVTAQSYKQELDKITADIDSINALKSTLKSQLADLDTKLGQAQEQLAATKKLSFELLSKEDEAEAGKVLESMKQTLNSMQQTQKTVDTTTIQEFNNTVVAIRNLMTSVQAQLQSLESKSAMLKATPSAPAKVGITQTPIPQPAKIAESPSIEKTLIHKFFNTVADIVTGSITMISSLLSSIKEMIIPTQPTITELEKMRTLEDAKKKIVPPTQTPMPTPIPPTPPLSMPTPMLPSPQAPVGSPAFADQVKANIAAIDLVVKKLDDQRISVKQMVKDIKKQAKGLTQRIDQNPDLKQVTSDKLAFNGGHTDEWKKTAQSWFSKFLNGLTTVHETVATVYNKLVVAVKKAWQTSTESAKKDVQKTPVSGTTSSK